MSLPIRCSSTEEDKSNVVLLKSEPYHLDRAASAKVCLTVA